MLTALARDGRYYPPSPTFTGAFVGGTVATNAAGAATFKYGTTRDWVRALTVVLPSGDVLDVERGETTAGGDGFFDIVLGGRTARLPCREHNSMMNLHKFGAQLGLSSHAMHRDGSRDFGAPIRCNRPPGASEL